jgi:ATP-binding cassette subfamily C (CFTR/MRP) protein 1
VNEILKGIRVIKMYAWEMSFKQVVEKIRSIEYDRLKRLMMLTGFQSFLIEFIPVLTSLVTFSVYGILLRKKILILG